MNKLIIVTGTGRCGTSMMMRCLEMGGVKCIYSLAENERRKSAMKTYRNIYGFYEGGEIPEEGNCAVKITNIPYLSKLKDKFDCRFIHMKRNPRGVYLSWKDVFSKTGRVCIAPLTEKGIKDYQDAITRAIAFGMVLEVDYDEFVSNPNLKIKEISECLGIHLDDSAVNGVDLELYKDRING